MIDIVATRKRIVSVLGLRRELLDIYRELRKYDQNPYVRRLIQALTRRLTIVEESPCLIQEPLIRQYAKIKKLSSPISWASYHQGYLDTFGLYLSSLRNYHKAIAGDDINEIQEATENLDAGRQEMDRWIDKYRVRLGRYYEIASDMASRM